MVQKSIKKYIANIIPINFRYIHFLDVAKMDHSCSCSLEHLQQYLKFFPKSCSFATSQKVLGGEKSTSPRVFHNWIPINQIWGPQPFLFFVVIFFPCRRNLRRSFSRGAASFVRRGLIITAASFLPTATGSSQVTATPPRPPRSPPALPRRAPG